MMKCSSAKKSCSVLTWSLLLGGLALISGPACAADKPTVIVQWSEEDATSTTAPSLLSIPYPNIRIGRPLHEAAISAIKSVNGRYVRYMPYCSHPRLVFPQLRAPTADQTFWDFSLIDKDLIAFLEATKGREPAINFSRIPHWLFKGGDSVVYPTDPDKVDWLACSNSEIGHGHMELADPTGKQVADYMVRIFSWYNQGGFTDELGKYHHSGHHYDLPWWGVFNEVDTENGLSPEQYTKVYDAVVAAIRKVNPATKFIGMELANATPKFVEYFLDPGNHVPGTPIDMVSVHFVRPITFGQPFDTRQYTDFEQLAAMIGVMGYVDAIRKRLSPTTLVKVGELTMIEAEDWFGALNVFGLSNRKPLETVDRIPKLHWNLAGAFYAAAFMGFEKTGVDIVAAAQLYGYGPQMLPSASLIDPRSGAPLPVIQVLRLLEEQLSSSRILVKTKVTDPAVYISSDIAAQAYRTAHGEKLLLVNKRARSIDVVIEGDKRIASVETVDSAGVKKSALARSEKNHGITLRPFAVSMISFN